MGRWDVVRNFGRIQSEVAHNGADAYATAACNDVNACFCHEEMSYLGLRRANVKQSELLNQATYLFSA